jgi:hypothetical protein
MLVGGIAVDGRLIELHVRCNTTCTCTSPRPNVHAFWSRDTSVDPNPYPIAYHNVYNDLRENRSITALSVYHVMYLYDLSRFSSHSCLTSSGELHVVSGKPPHTFQTLDTKDTPSHTRTTHSPLSPALEHRSQYCINDSSDIAP